MDILVALFAKQIFILILALVFVQHTDGYCNTCTPLMIWSYADWHNYFTVPPLTLKALYLAASLQLQPLILQIIIFILFFRGRVLQGYRCTVCQAATVHQDCLVNVSDICGRRTSVSASAAPGATKPLPPRPNAPKGKPTGCL